MPLKWVLFSLLIAISGCTSIKVEPADDQWERTEEKMPGMKTGDSGWYTIFSDKKKPSETNDGSTQAPVPENPKTVDSERSEFNEFREWQAWENEKQQNSSSYKEFQQWLKFQSLKKDNK